MLGGAKSNTSSPRTNNSRGSHQINTNKCSGTGQGVVKVPTPFASPANISINKASTASNAKIAEKFNTKVSASAGQKSQTSHARHGNDTGAATAAAQPLSPQNRKHPMAMEQIATSLKSLAVGDASVTIKSDNKGNKTSTSAVNSRSSQSAAARG